MNEITYYEVLDINWNSHGTFELFEDARDKRIDLALGASIRWWNGRFWIYNVIEEQDE